MTGGIDVAFVARVRAALDGEVRAILGEAGGDAWGRMQHRRLAERVKALVVAWCEAGDDALLGHAGRLVEMLRGRQGASGLFRGGDNVDSPPDSAFSINDLADAALLLRLPGGGGVPAAAKSLAAALDDLLAAATPALVGGGVHTPNHRWEISAALARLHSLAPRAALAERVEQWLAEGVDIADGLYSERSANYAAFVSNPSLLVVAEVFDRPELVDAVEQSLTATLDLLLPDGSVETVLSRRQDQKWPAPLAPFLLPLRRMAQLRGRGDLAWAAGVAQAQGIVSPGDAAARLLLDPAIAGPLPAPVAPARARRRVFGEAGLVVDHRPATTAVVFGGSDYPRHGRVRSGLANSPTFLRMYAGSVVLDSVRLSRTFFGLGPFRGERLAYEEAGAATVVTLGETVAASYYQPLAGGDRDAGGRYELGDDGRFSAAMDFGRRVRDEVALTTAVRVEITDAGVSLTVDVRGADVDWALELAFRPGGVMSGARLLDAADGSPVSGQVGDVAGGPSVPGRGGDAAGSSPAPGRGGDAAGGASVPGSGGEAVPGRAREAVPGRGGDAADGSPVPGHVGDVAGGSSVPGRGGDVAGSSPVPGRGGDAVGDSSVPGSGWGGAGGASVPGSGGEAVPGAGGDVAGGSPMPGDGGGGSARRRWELDVLPGGVPVRYQMGEDLLSVTVVEASDGAGGAIVAAGGPPVYHPGEDYEFLGGTDAAGGELLYLGGRAPARVRIDIKRLPASSFV